MSESLRVAVIASQFLPHRGGVEEVVRQLNRHLPSYGIQPTVLVNRWPRDLPTCEDVEGTRVHRLAFRIPSAQLKSKITYAFTHRAITKQAIRLVRAMRADLLHVHCISSNAEYAFRVRNATDLPLVVTTHGEVTNDAGQLFKSRTGWPRRIVGNCVQHSDAITAPTRSCLDDAVAWAGVNPRAIRIIGNGVSAVDFTAQSDEVDDLQSLNGRDYICAVGRLVPQKGFDVLIRAVSLLKNEGKLARAGAPIGVRIVGEGPERALLEEMIALNGLQADVQLIGQRDHASVAKLLRGACVAVLPSRAEAFGIANLEAMAAGCPVITSDLPGIREFVSHGVDGVLVAPGNAEALARAIGQLLSDPEACRHLVSAGRRTAAQHDWSVVAEQYATLYREVLARRDQSKRGVSVSAASAQMPTVSA